MVNVKNPSSEDTSVKKYRFKNLAITLLPVAALAVLFGLFCIVVTVNDYNLELYLTNVINRGTVLVLVATGAIFIYTLGSFDISLGASTLLCATVGVLTYNSTQNVVLTVVVMFAVGVGCSLLSSLLASVFRIPVFVTTVAMMSVLSAIASQLIISNGSGNGITLPKTVFGALDSPFVKVAFIAVWVLICLFIFNFTKIGRREKFLGANPFCAKLTGISMYKYAVIAFVIAGIGVALGAIFTLSYSPTVNTGTASSIGMDILVAIVFGGMPISGGPRSKIYASLIGGFSYVLLNLMLNIMLRMIGVDSQGSQGITQIISAVFFLAVVYLASMNYRAKNLPR